MYLIVEDILTDNPKIRLEPESYLYSDSTGIFLTENDTITRTIDYDKLFNRLVIGSETFIQDFGNVEPMYYTPFLSFVKETYNIDGVIGVDNELNLVSKYVIDSNEISDFIQGSNTNHDDKIFMVQYDAVNLTATKGEYFPGDNSNSKYYNEQLLNSNVAQRFDYLGTVALGLGNLDALFRAGQELPVIQNGLHIDDIDDVIWTVPPDTLTVYGRYRFDNDSTPPNFDTDNNFDLPLNQFVAPISGTYRFEFSFIFKVREVLPNPSYDMGAFIGFRIDGSQLSYPIQLK